MVTFLYNETRFIERYWLDFHYQALAGNNFSNVGSQNYRGFRTLLWSPDESIVP